MRFLRSLLTTALLVAPSLASNVIEVDSKTFYDYVGKGIPALVEFYAPWCGHCKNLAPIYEELADAFSGSKDKVLIIKTDADGDGKELGQKFGVSGFPTLKWFDGTPEPAAKDYKGGRTLEELASFVTKATNVKSSIKLPPPPATLELDSATFDKVVLDEDKDVLVAFTASWCGHCKALKPTFEKVAQDFVTESNCVIANFDADLVPHKPIGARYGVSSYPTIKFFPKGSKTPLSYEGGRSEADFVTFLNEQCGTHRAVGGGLNDAAGRHATLDSLASQFCASLQEERAAILDQASSVAASLGEGASYYLRIMQKLANGTDDYLHKETERLASILKKRTLAPSKLDEIKVKANILAAFIEKKAEEVAEEVQEKVADATNRIKEEL